MPQVYETLPHAVCNKPSTLGLNQRLPDCARRKWRSNQPKNWHFLIRVVESGQLRNQMHSRRISFERGFLFFVTGFSLAGSARAAVTNLAWHRLGEHNPVAASGVAVTNTANDNPGLRVK